MCHSRNWRSYTSKVWPLNAVPVYSIGRGMTTCTVCSGGREGDLDAARLVDTYNSSDPRRPPLATTALARPGIESATPGQTRTISCAVHCRHKKSATRTHRRAQVQPAQAPTRSCPPSIDEVHGQQQAAREHRPQYFGQHLDVLELAHAQLVGPCLLQPARWPGGRPPPTP
jgi:hypothetical protein